MKMLQSVFFWTSVSLGIIHIQAASVTDRQAIKDCSDGKPADVVFVLDASNSIWAPDFWRQLTFVEEMVDAFRIGPKNTQIGLVTYADFPLVQFHLNYYHTKSDIVAALDSVRQNGGSHTYTSEAIRHVREHCFSSEGGARENVTRLGVIITDGRSDDPQLTAAEAARARAAGIHLFAVGVGSGQDLTELNAIGSEPSTYYTFSVENYDGLQNIRDLLAIKACTVTDPPTTTTTTTTSTTTSIDNNQPSRTLVGDKNDNVDFGNSRSHMTGDKTEDERFWDQEGSNKLDLSGYHDQQRSKDANDHHTQQGHNQDADNRINGNDENDNNGGNNDNGRSNDNVGNSVAEESWSYDEGLKKWILRRARREDIRQNAGYWSYNERGLAVWTPVEYYYPVDPPSTNDDNDGRGGRGHRTSRQHRPLRDEEEESWESGETYSMPCRPSSDLDLIFVVDPKNDTKIQRHHIWESVRDVIGHVDMTDDHVRVQFIESCVKSDQLRQLMSQEGFTNKGKLIEAIESMTSLPKSTPELLDMMMARFEDIDSADGDLENEPFQAPRKKVAVYITDGPSGDIEGTIKAAQEARLEHDIEIFALTRGHKVNPTELRAVVSCDDGKHLYQIRHHSNSGKVHRKLVHALCKL